MGLFTKKAKDSGTVKWLNQADAAYSVATMNGQTDKLIQYLTVDCARAVSANLTFKKRAYSGIDKYKHVVWENTQPNVYLKHVTYDNLQMGGGLLCAVGDNYTEQWTISVVDGVNKVSEIRRLTA